MWLSAQQAFDVVDIIALITNGTMGGVLARRLNFDPVGFVVMAIVTALGGGIIRDLLIAQGPPVAMTHPAYLPASLVGALIVFLLPLRGRWTNRVLTVLDGVALGAWAATGTLKALTAGLDWLPSVLLGVMTAVGGGMVRDFMVGRVPAVFTRSPLYASAALIGAFEMLAFFAFHQPEWGMLASMVTVTVVVVLARRFNVSLPGPADWKIRRLPSLLRRGARSGNTPTGTLDVVSKENVTDVANDTGSPATGTLPVVRAGLGADSEGRRITPTYAKRIQHGQRKVSVPAWRMRRGR